MRIYFRLFERNRKPSLGALLDYMKASATLLKQNEATLSALTDAVTALQNDISTLGTAISDVQARVAALPSADDKAEVDAAVANLGSMHNDLTNNVAALAAIAPAAPAA